MAKKVTIENLIKDVATHSISNVIDALPAKVETIIMNKVRVR